MNNLIKLILYLIPIRRSDVVISMLRTKNNTGPSRFLNNLIEKSDLRYSKLGLINSKVLFVISNTSPFILALAKLLGKKIVVRVDGFSYMKRYVHSKEGVYTSRKMSLIRLKTNYQMAVTQFYSDFVIFQSDFSRRMSAKHIYPLSINNVLIYNGVDERHFRCNKKYESPKISILGNFRDVDLMELYLEAFSKVYEKHQDSELLIIGKQNGEVKAIISKFLSGFGISNKPKIKNIGAVTYEELPKFLSETNIGWHFTLWDWCPNSVLEQMASGNPVVCSEAGGTVELVGGAGENIDIKDFTVTDELLESIVLKTDHIWENIEEYSEAAVNRVKSEFGLKKMALNYEKVFNNI
jgi:glycosyltransferase involved in cell wall biosynthesis